ncbi:MAG: TIGR03067 domain-containing protein [Gemmataceae bacterium]|nr:TIGR03067 domain-containing protein [Gemmataceae bacterium]MDW8265887.1 TIGR03067 domain-containing protein [Gemmataceae bacterium]
MRSVFALGWMVLALAADVGADATQRDLDKLQGTWTLEQVEANGQTLPIDPLNPPKVVFKDNSLRVNDSGKFTFKLDATTDPKIIDLTTDQGMTLEGIYELTDEVLRLCFNVNTGGVKQRPVEFTGKADSGQALAVLRRVKP